MEGRGVAVSLTVSQTHRLTQPVVKHKHLQDVRDCQRLRVPPVPPVCPGTTVPANWFVVTCSSSPAPRNSQKAIIQHDTPCLPTFNKHDAISDHQT